MIFTGYNPSIPFHPGTGSLLFTGYTPQVVASLFAPPTARLVFTGQTPIINTFEGFDWRPTVISQYQNSPTLLQLVQNMSDNIDPGADLNQFYDLVWNIDTAQGYGLDVWGRIVGVGRVLNVPSGAWFGFQESTDANGFNQQPFFSGGGLTENFSLTDEAFRLLILAKALANITDGSIPAINQILLNLFPGRGNCFVTDGLDMTMTYTFDFPLSPVDLAIVESSNVLPRPAGVSVTVIHL
jgi:hypothetical protein